MRDHLLSLFFLGFIRIHILYHASQEEVFGLELMAELTRHGYQVGAGTLYPILHGLEEKQMLTSQRKLVDGKLRRYYLITQKGKKALAEARSKAGELIKEIMETGHAAEKI
jgi:PadR family transcriptional regulator, regulatory protein PadR